MRQAYIPPFRGVIKTLVIANVLVWILGVIIFQKYITQTPLLYDWFGLTPHQFIFEFRLWQPFTYMYLHSAGIFHVVFNMLLLWWMGEDLVAIWGQRFFFIYYTVCGVGAGILYTAGVYLYGSWAGDHLPASVQVVGASGAVFGLIAAYGILFSERIIYFFAIFPMKVKYFVLIVGGIEVMTLAGEGFNSSQATLAHLTGFLVGCLFLVIHANWSKLKRSGRGFGKSRRHLKLVVNKSSRDDKPPTWH